MKNYNKILKAVNRGIKFALDDFEDEEFQGQVNSKVNHQHGTKEWLDLMNDVIDLDLPSGTLWCKYNLDVNPNLLVKPEDWYGGYYAWGELEDKSKQGKDYNWKTYKFAKNGLGNDLTKYVTNANFGTWNKRVGYVVDNLTLLLPEDDIAYQNKHHIDNYKFHMPTKELFKELINYTNNYWVNNYDPNKHIHNLEDDQGIQGLNGRVFEGENGNLLFIPAAGYCTGFNIRYVGSDCLLWSSSLTLDEPLCVYYLDFNSGYIRTNTLIRCCGSGVRPVINL